MCNVFPFRIVISFFSFVCLLRSVCHAYFHLIFSIVQDVSLPVKDTQLNKSVESLTDSAGDWVAKVRVLKSSSDSETCLTNRTKEKRRVREIAK